MKQQKFSRCHRALMAALTEAREQADISKRELSAKLRRAPNFAHYVETGERALTVCEFIEYARALRVDPAALLKRVADA